jgi:hypothetical protein
MDRAKTININLDEIVDSADQLPHILGMGKKGIAHNSFVNGVGIGNVKNRKSRKFFKSFILE